jgi:hypothetical protein
MAIASRGDSPIPDPAGLQKVRHQWRTKAPDALVHGLRHTFATELAYANLNVYNLLKLARP